MTNEETLKIALSTNPLLRGGGDSSEYVECIIEALEKQIPKKPIITHCPKCDGWVYEPRNIANELYADTTFCSRCGQAIDWSDDND